MIYPSQPARFPAPLRTSLPENKQHQVCRSSSCHRSETALCKTTAWSSRPESRSDRQRVKLCLSRKQGNAICEGRLCGRAWKEAEQHPTHPTLTPRAGEYGTTFSCKCVLKENVQFPSHFPAVLSPQTSRVVVVLCPWSLSHTAQILPDTRCLATVLCKCLQFQPSVGRGRSGSCIFFKRTVSALKNALEISMFSRSLSSHLGFVFCRFIPPW